MIQGSFNGNFKCMKIITIVGARPQFIKAAMVSKALEKMQGIKEVLVHTGQHYDNNMSRVFFNELEINELKYNLGIGSGCPGMQVGRMIESIEKVLMREKPNMVLVYGDTNSTLAGALAGAKLNIPVAHIEAGLRSFNRKMPEEINRVVTDHVSSILFAPTVTAVENLSKEGITKDKVYFVGDVMYDSILHYGNEADKKSKILERLNVKPKGYILATIHRAQSTDNLKNLRNIVKALDRVNWEFKIILPLHPRTRKAFKYNGISTDCTITDPLGYFDILKLLKNCRMVMTDSGGLQKESFFFKKHCVVLREETEWVELVERGFNILSGTDIERIYRSYKIMIKRKSNFNVKLYGNGRASEEIVKILRKFCKHM